MIDFFKFKKVFFLFLLWIQLGCLLGENESDVKLIGRCKILIFEDGLTKKEESELKSILAKNSLFPQIMNKLIKRKDIKVITFPDFNLNYGEIKTHKLVNELDVKSIKGDFEEIGASASILVKTIDNQDHLKTSISISKALVSKPNDKVSIQRVILNLSEIYNKDKLLYYILDKERLCLIYLK